MKGAGRPSPPAASRLSAFLSAFDSPISISYLRSRISDLNWRARPSPFPPFPRDRAQVHIVRSPWCLGGIEWRTAGRSGNAAAARPVRRRLAGCRRHGHAALRPVHGRRVLARRIRHAGKCRPLPFPLLILAGAQREARALLSGDARHHRRSRRARRPSHTFKFVAAMRRRRGATVQSWSVSKRRPHTAIGQRTS
mgnify:CR=1 FL=1